MSNVCSTIIVQEVPYMSRITYVSQPCKSVLNRVQGMPFKWSINPYSGCSHACRYCYARAFYTRADRGTASQFDTQIYVKSNAPEVLRTELSRRSWKRELVVVGAATDPYQPAEGKYRITRRILEELADARTPVSIITKGPMVIRDIDLLTRLRDIAGVEVNMTIPSLDLGIWKALETGAPSPHARMEAVRRLVQAGIPTGIFMAPILPGISDAETTMTELMEAAADAGASYLIPIALRLMPGVREWFLPHLSRYFPHLCLTYCRLFQRTETPARYQQKTLGLARRLLRDLGLADRPPRISQPPVLAPQSEQLRLSL